MSGQVIFWGAVALVAVFIVSQLTPSPGYTAWRIVKAAIVGCFLIFACNWVGQYFHFHLPFNPVTAMTAGALGLPGLGALVILHLWMFQT